MRHLPPSERLESLARSAPGPYREELRELARTDLVRRHLKMIGIKADKASRVYFVPVSLARGEENILGRVARMIDAGEALYGTASKPDASESAVVTPDGHLELACIGHELQHVMFTAEGLRKPRAQPGSPGAAVEEFHVWVEEAAVTVGMREMGYNPKALDQKRFEMALRAIDECLGEIAGLYCIKRKKNGAHLTLIPRAMGRLAGLAYFAGACLGEAAAAEVLHRVGKARFAEPKDQRTLITIVTEGVTKWSLGTQIPTAAMVESIVARFAERLAWDLSCAHAMENGILSHERIEGAPPP